jgi:hypothetical protein
MAPEQALNTDSPTNVPTFTLSHALVLLTGPRRTAGNPDREDPGPSGAPIPAAEACAAATPALAPCENAGQNGDRYQTMSEVLAELCHAGRAR